MAFVKVLVTVVVVLAPANLATQKTVGPLFTVGNITENMGFVSGLHFVKQFKSRLTLSVPAGHVTLISFRYIYGFPWNVDKSSKPACGEMEIRLKQWQGRSLERLWSTCGIDVPSPAVYTGQQLDLVVYNGPWRKKLPSFKLLYSFHKKHSRSWQVNNGSLWNCSMPEWPRFQLHFLCNVERECEGWEDEVQCSYVGHCGVGLLTINNRCYQYIRATGKGTSWWESNQECRRRGGYLVSLNMKREWHAVSSVLRKRRLDTQVFVGFRDGPSSLPFMYRYSNMWTDNTIAYYFKSYRTKLNMCSRFKDMRLACRIHADAKCNEVPEDATPDFMCEYDRLPEKVDDKAETGLRQERLRVDLPVVRNSSLNLPFVVCPKGHLTHAFQACDDQCACWSLRRPGESETTPAGASVTASCAAPMTSLPAMFVCRAGFQRVPYSVVCDHRQQCADGSDEDFCVFAACASGSAPLKCGKSTQCVTLSAICDSTEDCVLGEDESYCTVHAINPETVIITSPPAIVYFGELERAKSVNLFPFRIKKVSGSANKSSPCPETHFQCPDNGYCLPVFVRCNVVNDCPGREDEAGCDGDSFVSCPGYYRCRSSSVCLHPSHVCDSMHQCPQNDDEQFCHPACPTGCTCHGLAFTCPDIFRAELHPAMRYVDGGGSGMTLAQLRNNSLVIHVELSRCGLETVDNVTLRNLRSLDLSHNRLRTIGADHLRGFPNLQFLSLSYNPLTSFFSTDAGQASISDLRTLDVSGVKMSSLKAGIVSSFPSLRTLNLSQCGVQRVVGDGFHGAVKLQVLDASGCPMTHFPRELLTRLDQLQAVYADNFKLCCPDTLPADFNLANCRAPFDEVSSCQSLLRSDVYVVFLSVFACLALLGNLSCFLLRSFLLKSSTTSFGVFVTNLSISDFLMGLYLTVIGVADRLFKGSYLWEDLAWRHSAACWMAGFLALTSNEASALNVCFITLDRFLVLRFPFSRLHFKARSAYVTCALVWLVVTAMASVPLTPAASHWSFYSQTGICIPLPVNRGDFAGRHYAFGILIIFNFVLFLLIATGQAAIYTSIQANRMVTADSTKKSNDLRIARRLITVAVSDFLCWFPIGLLGLLASRGFPISGEVNVGMAILVLPLNSAINPFLYTVNVLLERREKKRDEQLLKQLMARVQEEEKRKV